MNVVGKFGSLISQGVYSVATPFHPFSGAIDIIVVKQEDGSFRSTPWYVQFGKFQGVLKGAEKMVRINVNGVEAEFHMYLDNSGEAYFVREGELSHDGGGDKKGGLKDVSEELLEHSLSLDNDQVNVDLDNVENFSRLQSALSDPGILRDDFTSYRPSRLERNESDACRFYDFQDDHSFDSPVEFSPEYGSGRYDNVDVENFVEAQGIDSEMVLVSVDGHILKAPILSSEQNTEDIQLDTPQFHLGHGESIRFCEADNSLPVSENAQDSEYPNDLDAPSSQPLCIDTLSGAKNSHLDTNVPETCKVEDSVIPDKVKEICQDNGTDVVHASEACENGVRFGKTEDGGEEIADLRELNNEGCKEERPMADHKGPEAYSIEIVPKDMSVSSDVENASPVFKGEDRFKSCLDLSNHTNGEMYEGEEDSPTKAQEEVKDLEEKPSLDVQESDINETECASENPQLDDDSCSSTPDFQSQVAERVHTDIEAAGSASVSKDEDSNLNKSVKAANSSLDGDVSATETYEGEIREGQTMNSSEQREANLRPTIEISLCRHLLHPGMGSSVAAETFKAHCVSEEDFRSSAMSVIKNENLVIRYKDKYLPWEKAAPIVLGLTSFGLDIPVDSKDAIPVEQEVVTPKLGKSDIGSASGRRWRFWPNPFRRVKTLQHTNSVSSDEAFVDSDSITQSPSSLLQSPTSVGSGSRSETSKSPLKKIIRTNIATNEQIASLNLKEGQNDVTFSFSTRVLGLQQVEAHIYLWKWNTRIVISDVDGTITKSDVLGQFMPLVGKDWSQSGVARLFSAIQDNGYQLLFLSARAIVQAYLTKSFLFNLKQDGKTLPTGPVVISPDGLFPSLFREVIRRAPHEFKIACLEDIKALFPSDYNPFYAGFGNRDTDEYTYKKLGIPKGKIFIINPKGEVAINHRIDVKSYTSLHTLVDDMFPQTSMVEQEDYNSWNYWKIQIPEIDV